MCCSPIQLSWLESRLLIAEYEAEYEAESRTRELESVAIMSVRSAGVGMIALAVWFVSVVREQ